MPIPLKNFANRVAHMLLSQSAHGLATSTLEGIGEITLRDGLVVAAASMGAAVRQSWIIQREETPDGWTDSAVDLIISRRGHNNNLSRVGAIELKWWRQHDGANASNRRREILKDFIRAAALHTLVDEFAFVALLARTNSWERTTSTDGTDGPAMSLLRGLGIQRWNLTTLNQGRAVRSALRSLRGRINPISNTFHTELLSHVTIGDTQAVEVFAKVWSVRRPQRTRSLDAQAIDALLVPHLL